MHRPPIFLLTAYHGDPVALKNIVGKNIEELGPCDKWIIVFDNLQFDLADHLADKRVVYLKYTGPRGAGRARNFGLEHIKRNSEFPILLMPIDGDDELLSGSLNVIRNYFHSTTENMVSFGHIKKWPNKMLPICYDGYFELNDLLRKYITPCGSTVLRITDRAILNEFKFSNRKRSNDNLFFMQAAKYFGSFRCITFPVLIYNVGNPHSVSGKKYKQIFYKYLAFRDFGLGRAKSVYLLYYYIIIGFSRHILKRNI